MLHINEAKLNSEIIRVAGGRIAVACVACALIGGVLGALFF